MNTETDTKSPSTGAASRGGPPKVRHISAGPAAMAALESVLGLGGDEKGWRVTGLCASGGDGVSVRLRSGGHRLDFSIAPRDAHGLSLTPEGEAGPSVVKLLAVLTKRLGARRFPGLLRLIESDPLSFAEDVVPGFEGDRVKVPAIGQPISLLEAGWRNFYADQDFEVLLSVPSCSDKHTVNIEYADLECYYARPHRSFKKWTFLDWPQESEVGVRDDGEDSSIVTELEERDMIMGTGERADALVEEVRKRAKNGNFLLFTHLCTPIIMGEDFSGLARRCEKEVDGTSVRWSQKDRDDNDNFGEHFRSLLGRPGFFDAPADAAAVNLFHFPPAYREGELKPFLERIGLRTNITVMPDIRLSVLDDLPKAVWQVFCDRSSYPTKIQDLLAKTSRPVIAVPAPYGVEGTRECLRGIAVAAGKVKQFEKAWKEETGAYLAEWAALKKEAQGYRLAFVASEATLPRLMNLRYGCGAPLARMVLEMGFGVDIIYYDLHGATPKLPKGLEDARVTTFRTPWELERALTDGDFRAVYSDIVFDWRIMKAGKARFGGKDFEMGLKGARRTFDRLLSVCRLPFYRRYAAYLAGTQGAAHVE